MNEPKTKRQRTRSYLTAHKSEVGRWYFKEHKTKTSDLQTLLNNYKKGTENGDTKKTETNR